MRPNLTTPEEPTAAEGYNRTRVLAHLAAFLASGKSTYITGTTILVDGGLVRSVI